MIRMIRYCWEFMTCDEKAKITTFFGSLVLAENKGKHRSLPERIFIKKGCSVKEQPFMQCTS